MTEHLSPPTVQTAHESDRLVTEIGFLQKAVRDLILQQQISIPKYLANARQYLQNATTLNFAYHFQSQVLMRATTIVVTVTSAATLVIADRSWPINGFSILLLAPDGLLIRPEDNVVLTQASVGLLGLEFLGQEMPDRGKRW